jgi:hypothetical protein
MVLQFVVVWLLSVVPARLNMAVPESKRRVALIAGVTGQDGAYLAG